MEDLSNKKGYESIGLDSNVNIKMLDRNGHIIRELEGHNKATSNLVYGLLRFIRGDFNATSMNSRTSVRPEESKIYIPVKVQFGNAGVHMTGDESTPAQDRRFDYYNEVENNATLFGTSSLARPLSPPSNVNLTLERVRQVSYSDDSNGLALEFSLYLNPGKMVGEVVDGTFNPYSWSYYNPTSQEYGTVLSEVGLISDEGALLARIAFKGPVNANNGNPTTDEDDSPIIQSESTTIVLSWRIGIVSVNDDSVSEGL